VGDNSKNGLTTNGHAADQPSHVTHGFDKPALPGNHIADTSKTGGEIVKQKPM
jgi:hypothetical protein